MSKLLCHSEQYSWWNKKKYLSLYFLKIHEFKHFRGDYMALSKAGEPGHWFGG